MNNPIAENHEVVLVLADDVAYSRIQRLTPVGKRMPAVMPLNWEYPIKDAAICSPEVQSAIREYNPVAGDVFVRQYNGKYVKIGTTKNSLEEFVASWQGGLFDQLNRVVDALLTAGANSMDYKIKSHIVEKTDRTIDASMNVSGAHEAYSGSIDCDGIVRECLEKCRKRVIATRYELINSVKDIEKSKAILKNSGFFAEDQLLTILEKIEKGAGVTVEFALSSEDCVSSRENVNFALNVVANCPYCTAEIGTKVKSIINHLRTVMDSCTISVTIPSSNALNGAH